ncbi:MAG: glycosyltransferase family 2 protein [Candidatus Krumholzibacteria bacterium]|nr:glycosyltransferase family 2 protein [Candidatus Krumholzibacteria bacterium]
MSKSTLEKKNICGVVVTYHPDDGLEGRIDVLSGQVDHIVIVDNHTSAEKIRVLDGMAERKNVHLIRNARNLGVATALNEGMAWARQNGYAWAFLFDQDSVLEEGALDTLIDVFEDYGEADAPAVLGCNYRDVNACIVHYPDESASGISWRERKTVITSGSLVSIDVYNRIGPFRDAFFIDHVDDEYCLRARRRGYKVIATCKPVMLHSVGATTKHRLLWKRPGTTNHPAFRRYYMTRNHIILIKEYFATEPRWVYDTVHSRMKSLVLMCLFEKQRPAKIRNVLKGFFHGVFRSAQERV